MRIQFAMERLRDRLRPFGRRVSVRRGSALAGVHRFAAPMSWRKRRPMGLPPSATAPAPQIQTVLHVHPRADVVREKMNFVWLKTDAPKATVGPDGRTRRPRTSGAGAALEQARHHARHVLDAEVRITTYSSHVSRYGRVSLPRQAASAPRVEPGAASKHAPRLADAAPFSVVRPGPLPGRPYSEAAARSTPAPWPLAVRAVAALPFKSARQRNEAAFSAPGTGSAAGRAAARSVAAGAAKAAQRREVARPAHLAPAPVANTIGAASPPVAAPRKMARGHAEPVPAPLAFRAPPAVQAADRAADAGTVSRPDLPLAASTRPPSGDPRQSNIAQPVFDRATIDRLADDVIQRIERRGRIERERRGL